jgi:hypothetical protein
MLSKNAMSCATTAGDSHVMARCLSRKSNSSKSFALQRSLASHSCRFPAPQTLIFSSYIGDSFDAYIHTSK